MDLYKKAGKAAKKAYQNWATRQPYQILEEYRSENPCPSPSRDEFSLASEEDWGERRSKTEEDIGGNEITQNELIFINGFLACREEQDKEARRKEKEQSAINKAFDKPETSRGSEPSGIQIEDGGTTQTREHKGESIGVLSKAGVSFAPNLQSRTPKRAEAEELIDGVAPRNRAKERTQIIPEQVYD